MGLKPTQDETVTVTNMIIPPQCFSLSSCVFCPSTGPVNDFQQSSFQNFTVTYKHASFTAFFKPLDVGSETFPATAFMQFPYLHSSHKHSLCVFHLPYFIVLNQYRLIHQVRLLCLSKTFFYISYRIIYLCFWWNRPSDQVTFFFIKSVFPFTTFRAAQNPIIRFPSFFLTPKA